MPADLAVVLDTNVWISGIFFRRGIPARILAAAREKSAKPGLDKTVPLAYATPAVNIIIAYPPAFVKSFPRGAKAES